MNSKMNINDHWQLGMQAYSFNRFTFYEAVDKTAALGLGWIEAYPGQKLSPEKPDVKFGHTMPTRIKEDVKQKLAKAKVKLINYGVLGLPNDEAKLRQAFEFAKDMGIETITAEPPEEAFDLIEKLCKEYKIKVAIHNHPKRSSSRYWNPDKVLAVCKGRSRWIGACADTGHWARSGIDPVEGLKKLQGRIISLHFKDLNKFGELNAHDVPWGTGKCNVKAMLTELDRQGFKGFFAVEYEHNWENSMPDISKSIRYFDKVANELGHSRWQWLFNGKDLNGWVAKPDSWVVKGGGLLFCKPDGKGDIWTEKKFNNFVLDLEFKLPKGSNSGVFLLVDDVKKDYFLPLHFGLKSAGIEVQICDSYGKTKLDKKSVCGAVYDCLAPSKNMVKKPGRWNNYTIVCNDNKIYVALNHEQIIDMDLDLWTQAGKNPDGTPNKYKFAYKDLQRSGHIGLQFHHSPVWYRNIKIKPLD